MYIINFDITTDDRPLYAHPLSHFVVFEKRNPVWFPEKCAYYFWKRGYPVWCVQAVFKKKTSLSLPSPFEIKASPSVSVSYEQQSKWTRSFPSSVSFHQFIRNISQMCVCLKYCYLLSFVLCSIIFLFQFVQYYHSL